MGASCYKCAYLQRNPSSLCAFPFFPQIPMSIPVGYFSWRDRWTYSDDKERLPYQVGPLPHQVASTVAPKEAEKEAKDLAVTQKARSNAATAPAKGIPSVPINVTPTPETLKPQQPAKLSRYVHRKCFTPDISSGCHIYVLISLCCL